jgi:hypothetical protein
MNLKDALSVVHAREIAPQWQFFCKSVKDVVVYGTLDLDLKIHRIIVVVDKKTELKFLFFPLSCYHNMYRTFVQL